MTIRSSEEAAELGRRGGLAAAETRAAKARLRTDAKARKTFEKASPAMAVELVKAAKGEDEYAELDLEKRVNLMLRVLEFGIGRPGAGPKHSDSPDEGPATAPAEGLVIGGTDG